MSPSLGKKWLQKIQQCFNKKEQLAEHIEKYVSMLLKCLIFLQQQDGTITGSIFFHSRLGPLACFWYKVPDLTPELSSKLLPELDGCDHPRIKQVSQTPPTHTSAF